MQPDKFSLSLLVLNIQIRGATRSQCRTSIGGSHKFKLLDHCESLRINQKVILESFH